MHVRRTPSPRRRHKWSCSHRMTHTISVGLLEWGCNLRQQPVTGARTPPAKTGAELQSGAATTCTRCTSSRSMRQQPCRYHETAAVHAWSTHIPLAGGRSGAATRSDSASFFLHPSIDCYTWRSCVTQLLRPGGRISLSEGKGGGVRGQQCAGSTHTTVTQGKTMLECVTLPCTGSNQGLHEICRISDCRLRSSDGHLCVPRCEILHQV